ncbi:hypothetical protein WEH80_06425 [Actinomycetes bacterium KLBMP 9759]
MGPTSRADLADHLRLHGLGARSRRSRTAARLAVAGVLVFVTDTPVPVDVPDALVERERFLDVTLVPDERRSPKSSGSATSRPSRPSMSW